MYPPPPGAPDYPGLEVAGEIVALGDGVQRWKLGDRVCALVAGGGYATYCLAPGEQCLPVPAGLDMAEAAALPENWFTVRSEEHTSELQSLMRISYAVFCLKKKHNKI